MPDGFKLQCPSRSVVYRVLGMDSRIGLLKFVIFAQIFQYEKHKVLGIIQYDAALFLGELRPDSDRKHRFHGFIQW